MSRYVPLAVRAYASDVACLACILGTLAAFFIGLDVIL